MAEKVEMTLLLKDASIAMPVVIFPDHVYSSINVDEDFGRVYVAGHGRNFSDAWRAAGLTVDALVEAGIGMVTPNETFGRDLG